MAFAIKDTNNRPVVIKGQQAMGQDNFESEAKDFNDKERSFTAVASRATKDRMGDIINVDGWQLKNYRKNSVVMPFHDYRALPVGRSLEEFVKKDKLIFRPQFASYPQATLMFSLYRDKYLKGFSVGFIALKSEPIPEKDKDKKFFFHTPTRFLKSELLEVSAVPVPAHPDALSEIKSYVQKGELFIPASYLQEDEGTGIEMYDKHIHVIESDQSKFSALYITPFMTSDDGEKTLAWVVFGSHKEDDSLYFNQRFIFLRDEKSTEVKSLQWVKDNGAEIDVNKDDASVILYAFDKEISIELKEYTPEQYETKAPILIEEFPACDPSMFDCGAKIEEVEEGEEDDATEGDKTIEDFDMPDWDDIEGEDLTLEDVIDKPYPNEHACRLNDPGKYTRMRRNNCRIKSDGKCIDVIFGRKKDGKTEIQAMRYPKKSWDAGAARSHCKGKGGTFEAASKDTGKDVPFSEEDDSKRCIEELQIEVEELTLTVDEMRVEVESMKLDISELRELQTIQDDIETLTDDALDEDEDELLTLDVDEDEEEVETRSDEPVHILELEDEIQTQTPDDEIVLNDETKGLIKSTIKAELGQLD